MISGSKGTGGGQSTWLSFNCKQYSKTYGDRSDQRLLSSNEKRVKNNCCNVLAFLQMEQWTRKLLAWVT